MTRSLPCLPFITLTFALGIALLAGCDVGALDPANDLVDEDVAHQGDPAVAGLVVKSAAGMQLCSGVLIAPRVVLSAAGCVSNAHGILAGFGPVVAPGGSVAAFGGTVDAFGGTVDAFGGTVDAFRTAGASFIRADQWVPHPSFALLAEALRHDFDIAVIHLVQDAPALPLGLNDTGALLQGGTSVRALGFGYASSEGLGRGSKHERTFVLGTVAPYSYQESPGATALAASRRGDIGGPTLVRHDGQDYVLGVHASPAASGAALDTRVDAHIGFIDQHLAAWQ